MKKTFLSLGLAYIILSCVTCNPTNINQNTATPNISEATLNYDSLFLELTELVEVGMDNPMEIIHDTIYHQLIDHPAYRPKVRELLKQNAFAYHAVMVTDAEPGKRIQVTIVVQDEFSQQLLPNVAAEIIQADEKGLYFDEDTKWNPRLFSYLKTNDVGELVINTIYPGGYQDDEGNDVAIHIHFVLELDGYRPYGSEFTFEHDPIFKANGNVEHVPVAKTIGENSYRVIIPLQPK